MVNSSGITCVSCPGTPSGVQPARDAVPSSIINLPYASSVSRYTVPAPPAPPNAVILLGSKHEIPGVDRDPSPAALVGPIALMYPVPASVPAATRTPPPAPPLVPHQGHRHPNGRSHPTEMQPLRFAPNRLLDWLHSVHHRCPSCRDLRSRRRPGSTRHLNSRPDRRSCHQRHPSLRPPSCCPSSDPQITLPAHVDLARRIDQ